MDPVAHTLVGAALAETGLRRATPLATATLVLGANAPDIDIVSAVAGSDATLYFRRGLTHGVVALVALPFVLTGLMLLFDRWVRRRRHPDAPPARAGALLGLAFLSILTHPALDYLNTYGVRALMPFDDRWLYGDALFILDPWLWLLTGAAVVLARRRGRVSAAAFIVLGSAMTAVVVSVGAVPVGAKVAWGLGVVTLVALRVSQRAQQHIPRIAVACVLALVVYASAMVAGSELARADATAWLRDQGIAAEASMAGPILADPFRREVIARADGTYYFVERAFFGEPGLRFSEDPLPVGPHEGAVVRAALAAPEVRGLAVWLRYPSFAVERTDFGYRVSIRDVRYSRRGEGRLGTAVVELDHALEPR